jgi:hypothetical protein
VHVYAHACRNTNKHTCKHVNPETNTHPRPRSKPISQYELSCTYINRLSHTCMKCHSSTMNKNGKCEDENLGFVGCCLRSSTVLVILACMSDVHCGHTQPKILNSTNVYVACSDWVFNCRYCFTIWHSSKCDSCLWEWLYRRQDCSVLGWVCPQWSQTHLTATDGTCQNHVDKLINEFSGRPRTAIDESRWTHVDEIGSLLKAIGFRAFKNQTS